MPRRYPTFLIWLSYVVFVVYGSLVPFRYTPRALDAAWVAFLHMPFLRLGLESRADWVANGVLYVPAGFLTAMLLAGMLGRGGRWLAYGLAVLFGWCLALVVEFVQLFFPPRTVSLNDLLAEGIGTGLGVVLAVALGGWFRSVLTSLGTLLEGGRARWLLQAYVAWYLAFALFPFDFLISWGEIERKANSAMWGWWAAGEGSGGFLFLLRLAAEVALTVPVGWALAARGQRGSIGFAVAGILGLLLGAGIELAQFFVASGVSQGVSVLTRALGVVLGVATWRHRADWAATLRGMPTFFKLVLAGLYGAVLLTANGWFAGGWHWAGVGERLGDVHFLPFYYHYFTTEAKALYSVASVCLMYAPLGALVWLVGGRAGWAAILSVLVAVGVEAGKLFLGDGHPDPTNLLLAAVASGLTVRLAEVLTRHAGAAAAVVHTPVVPAVPTGAASGQVPSSPRRHEGAAPAGRPGPITMGFAGVAFLALIWNLAGFPFMAAALGLGIATAGVAAWRRPAWLFVIAPAALPVLDLAPWSGHFYLDEFDLLLLALVPVAYLRTSPGRRREPDGLLWGALGLLAFSVILSTVIGLGGVPSVDANSFTNYFSPFNALRIAKGFAWALLLLGVFRRFRRGGDDVRPLLAWGMVLGFALTVAVILWERVTFSGLFNFDSVYRATGPFSAIHTGGAYIECFLAAAIPFLVVLMLERRAALLRLAGLGLLVAATYGLMVTYSRNGYAAYGLALAIVFFFALFARELRWKRFVLPVVLGGQYWRRGCRSSWGALLRSAWGRSVAILGFARLIGRIPWPCGTMGSGRRCSAWASGAIPRRHSGVAAGRSAREAIAWRQRTEIPFCA